MSERSSQLDVVQRLAGDIGVRLSGEEATRAAAEEARKLFRELGLQVETQEFPFVGWKPEAHPRLELFSPAREEIEAAPISHSTSTPPGGLIGRVRKAGIAYMVPGELEWPRYAIVDEQDRPRGYLIGHVALGAMVGRAMPVSNPEPLFPSPIVLIGQRDHERLSALLDQGVEVRARLETSGRILPDRVGRNVVASLPGSSPEHVLLCAHYDTAPWSPGAVDNASGVQALYEVARRLVSEPKNKAYRFVAFDANLMHFLGSRYYVNELQAQGQLGDVKAAINLDTVGAGDTFILPAWPDDIGRKVAEAARDICASGGYQVLLPGPLAGSDHWSFREKGVPMVEILCWPFEGYHREDDTADRVDSKAVTTAAELALALAHSLA